MHFPFSRIVSHKDSPLSIPSYNARQKSGGGKTKDPFPNGENFTPLPQQEEERILELLDSSPNHLSFLPPPENGNLEEFSAEFSFPYLSWMSKRPPPLPLPTVVILGRIFLLVPLISQIPTFVRRLGRKTTNFFCPGDSSHGKIPGRKKEEDGRDATGG